MPTKMSRGKQQILFNYLPGKTFDFERNGVIARVDQIRGTPRFDLNAGLMLSAIKEYASAWAETNRPTLRDEILARTDQFILLDPREVSATMFPSVFWCQNSSCGRVLTRPDGDVPAANCPTCKVGRLVQLRFVRVHRCGSLQPLHPPYRCKRCQNNNMALDTRGSERISNFRWLCLKCRETSPVFGWPCRECDWTTPIPGVDRPRNANIEVHRAGRTFFRHHVVLLNQPSQELTSFLATDNWEHLAGAAFLEFPELAGRSLTDLRVERDQTGPSSPAYDEATLMSQGYSSEQVQQFLAMQAQLAVSHQERETANSPTRIAEALVERTGVPDSVWQRSGQEMLEAVLPLQSSTTQQLLTTHGNGYQGHNAAAAASRSMGFEHITLVVDFPVTTATFGFSRVDDHPNRCRLNPFPPDRDHEGRFPIFVDLVQADAIIVRLDPAKVWRWLAHNGQNPSLPTSASDQDLATRAYFIDLLDGVPLRETLHANRFKERMVFGLLHTLSHLAVRQATLLCGLDSTSLSEYILPKALTFALYCNHRFGATIGALASLYEQSLNERLRSIREANRCVYDPVCGDRGGNCHACTHLSETSCRFFNLNLSRSLLYGGVDPELGAIRTGYFDIV